MTLHSKEYDQDWCAHDQGSSGKHRPAAADLSCLQRVKASGQGVLIGARHKRDGKEILIPNIDEDHHSRDQNTRLGKRENDPGDQLKIARTIDGRSLLNFDGNGVKIAFHVPKTEYRHGPSVDKYQPDTAVHKAHGTQQLVDGKHGKHRREGVQKEQNLKDRAPSGKTLPGENIGSGYRCAQRDQHGADRQDHAVSEPEHDRLLSEHGFVIVQRELFGDKAEVRTQQAVFRVQRNRQCIQDRHQGGKTKKDKENMKHTMHYKMTKLLFLVQRHPQPSFARRRVSSENAMSTMKIMMDTAEL